MNLFTKPENFDDLIEKLPAEEKTRLLMRFLRLEIARSWLQESNIKFNTNDLISLTKSLE
jgi:hypothetical protein